MLKLKALSWRYPIVGSEHIKHLNQSSALNQRPKHDAMSDFSSRRVGVQDASGGRAVPGAAGKNRCPASKGSETAAVVGCPKFLMQRQVERNAGPA
jgi:hypothetical protein